MILSYKHRFIFIKGVKVAGTSVELALSACCGDADILAPIMPADEKLRIERGYRGAQNYSDDVNAEREYQDNIRNAPWSSISEREMPQAAFYNHMPLWELEMRIGALEGYEVVCVERCPYRKVISWANWSLNLARFRRGESARSSFAELRAFVDQMFDEGAVVPVRNIDRYRRLNGSLGVTRIIRYETLQHDFDEFLAAIDGSMHIALPHAKMGILANELHVQEVLTSRQIDKITEYFADEFAAFGYPVLHSL